MSVGKIKQTSIDVPHDLRREVRTQFGALCWRLNKDKVEILLITSRRSGRWIVPKGWAVEGATPAGAAQTEAWEEAGAEGKVETECLGIYSYNKAGVGEHESLPCVVALFPMRVRRLIKDYPEAGQRRRKWFAQKKAASLVDEPELREIIRQFSPRKG